MFLMSRVKLASVSRVQENSKYLLIQDVSVFDGTTMLYHQDVLTSGAVISEVGITETFDFPDEAERIDGSNKTLLPGLIDSHVHVFSAGEKDLLPPSPENIAQAFLYAGITTALIAAGFDEATDLSQSARDGKVLAPHLYTGGPGLTSPNGHPIPFLKFLLPWPIRWFAVRSVVTANSAEEARQKTKHIAEKFNSEFLQITYNDLPPGSTHLSLEALEASIIEAKNLNIRPMVDTIIPSESLEAAEAGAELLVHIPQHGILSDDQVSRLLELNVPVVTTINLVSASHELAKKGPTELEKLMIDKNVLDKWQKEPAWNLPGFFEEIDTSYEKNAMDARENFRRLLSAGIPIMIGTDSGVPGVFPGSSIHRELNTVVDLGMTPIQALAAATSLPASFLDPNGSYGRIAPGQRADMLLVLGDPSINIADISNIEKVFLEGVELNRYDLRGS